MSELTIALIAIGVFVTGMTILISRRLKQDRKLEQESRYNIISSAYDQGYQRGLKDGSRLEAEKWERYKSELFKVK